MKKLTIGLLVLCVSSASFAKTTQTAPTTTPKPISAPVPSSFNSNYFEGAYIGIGGGVSHTGTDAKANVNNGFFVEGDGEEWNYDFPSYLHGNIGVIDVAGEAFAGFGRTFGPNGKRFYTGVEVFGKWTPSSMTMQKNNKFSYEQSDKSSILFNDHTDVELSNDYTMGGEVRFGYLINPKVMFYVLAGIDIGDFTYRIHNNGPNFIELRDLNADHTAEGSEWSYGFMPGVGLEAMITNKLSLRAQYVYTFWGDGDDVAAAFVGKMDNERSQYAAELNSTINGKASSIERGLFTLDLTYHFNGV